ncbi:MAG TPA: hypothetical protein VM598_03985 [Bdellovibrionota bacterium]|nr:hypothetical protein [Bdellovibrionota bacterium]
MTEELIRASDFRSIELKIRFTNSTSRTLTESGVRLIEFTERGLALEVPKASCAQGHNLAIEITRVDVPDSEPMQLTGKVESFVEQRADVGLVQYDEKKWEDLQALFNRRQEEILAFISSTRGY